jgi:PHD/YefM family antitoxin component YafN of YafNO toxin-antitoxin module
MLETMEKKTISMAQLAKNAEQIASDIEASGALYRIKRPGGKTMLLMDKAYFDSWVATLEFMQDHPNWRAELDQAERDYRAGLFIPYEQVRKELGLDRRARAPKRGRSARGTSGGRPKGRR